jgi:hypothetical protein
MVLDPLYVANEGELLAIVASEDVDFALKALSSHSLGKDALYRIARRCGESTVCKISSRSCLDKFFSSAEANRCRGGPLSQSGARNGSLNPQIRCLDKIAPYRAVCLLNAAPPLI